jgi:hypothetical protein
MQKVVLATAYLGPIQYYTKFLLFDEVKIEQHETYPKQTFRNRCRIMGANGPLDLTIPVIKVNGNHTMVKDIQIDYSTRWQANHWRSIISAYNSSPFFEYYCADFEFFHTKKFHFLIDFNQQLNEVVLDLLELEHNISLTESYEKNYAEHIDLRNLIHPKPSKELVDDAFASVRYSQTFSEKVDFYPNLSIIDLLFNQGPDSLTVLQKCIVEEGLTS